jgi:hypothetical protein
MVMKSYAAILALYPFRPTEHFSHPDEIGLIASFFDPNSEKRAAEQADDAYQHGGGWRPQDGYRLTDGGVLTYRGDVDPLHPLAVAQIRSETVRVYHYGLVSIQQANGSFEVSRMD